MHDLAMAGRASGDDTVLPVGVAGKVVVGMADGRRGLIIRAATCARRGAGQRTKRRSTSSSAAT